jgi:hypothetical protein
VGVGRGPRDVLRPAYGRGVTAGACAGTTVVSARGTVALDLAPGRAIAIDVTTRL